jgi:hypothetical protein
MFAVASNAVGMAPITKRRLTLFAHLWNKTDLEQTDAAFVAATRTIFSSSLCR